MNTATSRHRESLSSPSSPSYQKDVKTDERTSRASRASSSASKTRENPGNDRSPWNFMADIMRQQLAVATQSTSALYRGVENLRRIQQETARQASARHGDAAEKLFSPCQPSDLLLIQAELLRANLQSAGQYWQQLMAGAMQMPGEMMASMGRLQNSQKGAGVKSALDVFQATLPVLTSGFFVTGANGQDRQDGQDGQDYPHH